MKETNELLQKEEVIPWLGVTSHIKPYLTPKPRLRHGCPTSLPREARLPQAGQHQRDTTEALTPHAVGLEQLQSSGKHQLRSLALQQRSCLPGGAPDPAPLISKCPQKKITK